MSDTQHQHPDAFDPTCKRCRPQLFNASGSELPPGLREAIDAAFDSAPLSAREAWYRVTVKRSTDPEDNAKVAELVEHLDVILKGVVPVSTNPDAPVLLTALRVFDLFNQMQISPMLAITALEMNIKLMESMAKDPEVVAAARARATELFQDFARTRN